ncbi:unnamed protein product [Urochloa humidicola]
MPFAGVRPDILLSAAGTDGLFAAPPFALRLVTSPCARALPEKMNFPNPKLHDLAAPRASSARQAAASHGAGAITATPFADLRARICSPTVAIEVGFGVVPPCSFVVLKPPTCCKQTYWEFEAHLRTFCSNEDSHPGGRLLHGRGNRHVSWQS